MHIPTQFQEELRAGVPLAKTSAGGVIFEEVKDLQQKHDNEIEELKRELEEAKGSNNAELQTGLEEDLQKQIEALRRLGLDETKLQTLMFSPAGNASPTWLTNFRELLRSLFQPFQMCTKAESD